MQEIQVVHIINGTTIYDAYQCSNATITMAGANADTATVIRFVDGSDPDGPVVAVLYRHAEKITRRPLEDHKEDR